MEIRRKERESQRRLKLDKGFREATADYLRALYPTSTAKQSARRFDLTLDQARSAVAGTPSLGTIERIVKTGGWTVALAILADVIGTGIANYIIELGASHERHTERLNALIGGGWLAAVAGGDDPAGLDNPQAERRITERRRVG